MAFLPMSLMLREGEARSLSDPTISFPRLMANMFCVIMRGRFTLILNKFMTGIKAIFTKTTLLLFIFLPLQAYAQTGSLSRDEELQAMMDKMEADLSAIS